ncbi:hypothetical protein [Rhodococcus sp. IEGM 1379]|uniref:hypothetical protein n=1 Tax=Rhodococcus sp. IEGM 1379 TaxID=3047086 RepID=UPI0024B82DBE|nr:hypothetical protein [Rhodococcus sp. IEGM 1379]MDI9915112.1 hypothetical protein [Rhodococcus sp. IEGM 1379]
MSTNTLRNNTTTSDTTTAVTTALISNSSGGALYLVKESNPNGRWIVPPADYILPNMNVHVVATSTGHCEFPIVLTYRAQDGAEFVFASANSREDAGTLGTSASVPHRVSTTMTSGYPSLNVAYVLV